MDVEVFAAFSPTVHGGSPAGVVVDAGDVTADEMQRIAQLVGAPATGFVTDTSKNEVSVRFFSTITEYGVCGHGTIAVLTALVDAGLVPYKSQPHHISVCTPSSRRQASMQRRTDGRVRAMLTLEPATIEACGFDPAPLLEMMGGDESMLTGEPAVSRADFTHLMAPMDLGSVTQLDPDFQLLAVACNEAGIDTVAAYSMETIDPAAQIHTRDFCPAVGTNEAAATGTTNRAILGQVVASDPDRFDTGDHLVTIEQGIEMGRPSRVEVRAGTKDGCLVAIAVGGVATAVKTVTVG